MDTIYVTRLSAHTYDDITVHHFISVLDRFSFLIVLNGLK